MATKTYLLRQIVILAVCQSVLANVIYDESTKLRFKKIGMPRSVLVNVDQHAEEVVEIEVHVERSDQLHLNASEIVAEGLIMQKSSDGNPNKFLSYDFNSDVNIEGQKDGSVRITLRRFGYHLDDLGAISLLRVWTPQLSIVSTALSYASEKDLTKLIILENPSQLISLKTGVYWENCNLSITVGDNTTEYPLATFLDTKLLIKDEALLSFLKSDSRIEKAELKFENQNQTLVFLFGIISDTTVDDFKFVPFDREINLEKIKEVLAGLGIICNNDFSCFNSEKVYKASENSMITTRSSEGIVEFINERLNASEIVFINGKFYEGSFEPVTTSTVYGKELVLSYTTEKDYRTMNYIYVEPHLHRVECHNMPANETLIQTFAIWCPLPAPARGETFEATHSFKRNGITVKNNEDGIEIYTVDGNIYLFGTWQQLGDYTLTSTVNYFDPQRPTSSVESSKVKARLGTLMPTEGKDQFIIYLIAAFSMPIVFYIVVLLGSDIVSCISSCSKKA